MIFLRTFVLTSLFYSIVLLTQVYAQSDPLATVQDFSDRSIAILKGPVTKILAAVILLAGVGGLLRGRHRLALSCAVAFVVLLFLPILLQHAGTGR